MEQNSADFSADSGFGTGEAAASADRASTSCGNAPATDDPRLIRQWRRYLANELVEERVYRSLAMKKTGDERRILIAIANAERRHQQHWRTLLGHHADKPGRPDLGVVILAMFARMFGSIFVLALAQQAESSSPYIVDEYATEQMAADERVHAEVVRALATKSRSDMSGNFRAAVFGANDGLVSNLALVMGVGAAGLTSGQVLLTGISGLLAGALSMGAGEYISVRSQHELIDASNPEPDADSILRDLDINANELALVFQARGMAEDEAELAARTAIGRARTPHGATFLPNSIAQEKHEGTGSGLGAAVSSFLFFSAGAVIPIIPYFFGLDGTLPPLISAVLVSMALLFTGGVVGVLSGKAPMPRALRQLAIGLGAAAVTYALGMLFGSVAG